MKKLISIVSPVYQNQGSLSLTYSSIVEVFAKLPQYEFEIVFVNDGSTDKSLDELEVLFEQDKRVKVINFSKNFGQLFSTIAGHRYASGEAVITVSADLQDPLSLIPQMLNSWENGNEVVICHRIMRNDGLLSKITSWLFFKILKANTSSDMPSGGFDYYLLDRKAIDYLNKVDDKMRILHFDVFSLGFKRDFISYERLKREIGVSQYNFTRRFKAFYNTFYTYSRFPITFMIYTGMFTFLSGIIYSIGIVIAWLQNKTPFNGWAPLMILILVIGGMLMVMLGIVGEYVYRVFDEIKKRPTYFIKKIYDKTNDKE